MAEQRTQQAAELAVKMMRAQTAVAEAICVAAPKLGERATPQDGLALGGLAKSLGDYNISRIALEDPQDPEDVTPPAIDVPSQPVAFIEAEEVKEDAGS